MVVQLSDGVDVGTFKVVTDPGTATRVVLTNITATVGVSMGSGAQMSLVAGEALALNAITFEVFPEKGTPRLKSAQRA
jgi:hypothetical protein